MYTQTVRNLHFLSINSTLISRENCRFFWCKTRENVVVLDFFRCWQLWFHEKNCQKKNLVKNSWKCWGFVKIEFLDKNVTFRIVCITKSILILSFFSRRNHSLVRTSGIQPQGSKLWQGCGGIRGQVECGDEILWEPSWTVSSRTFRSSSSCFA